MTLKNSDPINHPSHYNSGTIEVIEAIEDWNLDYHRGNAVKYIARAGRKVAEKSSEEIVKQATIQDLEKAIWYIRRSIELLQPEIRRPNDMNTPVEPVYDKEGIEFKRWTGRELGQK